MSTVELKRLTIIQKIVDKHLTQVIAAVQLGLTVRQVKRLVKKFHQNGAEGLVSKKSGQIGNCKYSDKKIKRIIELVVTHYYDFGAKFATEKLEVIGKSKVKKKQVLTKKEWRASL